MTNAKEDPRYTETASKVGQANSPGGKQTDKESTKKKEETRGKGKGGHESPAQAKCQIGRDN